MGKQTRGKTLGRTPDVKTPQRAAQGPTVDERLRRLNPQERVEVHGIIRKLLLRKTIRQTLAIAYHSKPQPVSPTSPPASSSGESKELSPKSLQTFEPVIVHGPRVEQLRDVVNLAAIDRAMRAVQDGRITTIDQQASDKAQQLIRAEIKRP